MKSAYRVLSYIVAAGVLLQAGTIAFAWFSVLSEIDQGAVLDANFEGMPGTSGTELS